MCPKGRYNFRDTTQRNFCSLIELSEKLAQVIKQVIRSKTLQDTPYSVFSDKRCAAVLYSKRKLKESRLPGSRET